MPETLIEFVPRQLLACTALTIGLMLGGTAFAQMNQDGQTQQPQGGQGVNPICPRLEAQLASIDRGGGDPAREEQIRRYQDAATRQQAELDRIRAQARKMGCDNSGFFSLFSAQSAQCGPVNNQIQQMRANLDQMTGNLEQLRSGGGPERDSQRRSVLIALAQNNCGPQYANAAVPSGPGGFLNSLFGGNNNAPPGGYPPAGMDNGAPSGTFRTVCVRSCDGGYFPISFATVQSRFGDDERTCKALCPATEANLFTYRNPGEDINQAVSNTGQPYTSLQNAFRFRTEFNPSCSCKAPGQTWADALKSIDDKSGAEQGDITVTEESAKKMQQRPLGKQIAGKKGAAQPPATAANPAPPDAPAQTSGAAPAGADKQIRTVGPTFIPATR
ncbi:MAG: DUF2865 domain-containing protein [Bradyrhizobium sp.]|uniref:DUF2865 domain-containing protein n=1 Tax=Bradyrhizobium sp. TaxID=376 RepID=UPI001DE555CE|nr:DUF2865 domain-containing protein [Bradyrhizobium sp.]MBV9560652.1 DUF2865 domain-containing protein [Bradyrhizobium sp.]